MTISLSLMASPARKAKRVKPNEHFKACPQCGSKELIPVGPDALCSSCDWNSCLWDVQRGGMNNLERAVREFFGPERAVPQKKEESKETEKLGA